MRMLTVTLFDLDGVIVDNVAFEKAVTSAIIKKRFFRF